MDSLNKIEYQEYALLYVDILGIKGMLKNESEDCEVLNAIRNAVKTAKDTEGFDYPDALLANIRTMIFSDNIVFAIPVDKSISKFGALAGVVNLACLFQTIMFEGYRFFIRGAITVGPLFINDQFVIGKALVRAYNLENNLAIYPRIIVDPETLDSLKPVETAYLLQRSVMTDTDGIVFVDHLSVKQSQEKEDLIKAVTEEADKVATSSSDEKVRQKMNWIKGYALRRRLYDKLKDVDESTDELGDYNNENQGLLDKEWVSPAVQP